MYFFQEPDIFDQTFGPPNGGFDDRWATVFISLMGDWIICLCQHTVTVDFLLFFDRDLQIESLKQDLELLRAELERVKAEVNTE